MAAHSNDKTILGDGLRENVRSYMLERVLDFAQFAPNSNTYFEIGTLPPGFVPRNVAILQLTPANTASAVTLYKTVEDSSSGTATAIVSASLTSAAPLASAFAAFDKGTVASSASTVTPSVGAQLAVKTDAGFTAGRVKVVISGDRMAGPWDFGDASAPPIAPADAVGTVEFAASGDHADA